MTVNRVVYFPDTDIFRFNDPKDSFDLGASFQEGGVNRELTIWVQTESDKVSFVARDHIVNHGGQLDQLPRAGGYPQPCWTG